MSSVDTAFRLLLIVPYMNRQGTGEDQSNFQWASRLAAVHETTVLTIERPGVDLGELRDVANVVSFPEVGVHRLLRRGPGALRRLLYSRLNASYGGFFRSSLAWLKDRGAGFDLVHQIGPLAPRYPSPLVSDALRPTVRRVIGPVGGNLSTPLCVREHSPSAALRDWFVERRLHGDTATALTYERADLVIGVAPYVSDVLREFRVRRFAFIPEMGFDALPGAVSKSTSTGPLRLVYVGRVIRTKGLEDGIAALARIPDVPWTLTVIGDGPRLRTCQSLCNASGLDGRIRFLGWMAKAKVDEELRHHDAMLFPSFREPGGNAVMEAMAAGLPVITSNLGGPAFMVDDRCGYRIDLTSIEQFRHDLSEAIRRLAEDRALCRNMGIAAVERATEFGWWPNKIDWMSRRYREILE